MQRITDVVDELNCTTLGGADKATLRSRLLTATESAAADCGGLNIVTGFQLINGGKNGFRLLVLEGLPAAMSRVAAVVPRTGSNTGTYRVLWDPDPAVRFHSRIYTGWSGASGLKALRLRETLHSILLSPATYDRAQVWQ